MDYQKRADTPLTNAHFLLLIPVKAFPTGISSSVLRLFAAASLEGCYHPGADCVQKQGILCFVPSCIPPATHVQDVILGMCSVSTQRACWVHFAFAAHAKSLWEPVWRQGTHVRSPSHDLCAFGCFTLIALGSTL